MQICLKHAPFPPDLELEFDDSLRSSSSSSLCFCSCSAAAMASSRRFSNHTRNPAILRRAGSKQKETTSIQQLLSAASAQRYHLPMSTSFAFPLILSAVFMRLFLNWSSSTSGIKSFIHWLSGSLLFHSSYCYKTENIFTLSRAQEFSLWLPLRQNSRPRGRPPTRDT